MCDNLKDTKNGFDFEKSFHNFPVESSGPKFQPPDPKVLHAPDNLSIYEEVFSQPPPPYHWTYTLILPWAYAMYGLAYCQRAWKYIEYGLDYCTTYISYLIRRYL